MQCVRRIRQRKDPVGRHPSRWRECWSSTLPVQRRRPGPHPSFACVRSSRTPVQPVGGRDASPGSVVAQAPHWVQSTTRSKGWIERPRLHPKVKSVRLSTNTMSIRERLYPQEQELSVLVRHCSDARYVWNLALEQRNSWRRRRSQRITTHSQDARTRQSS